jgi:proteasome lid subunit RPN8/RPN11
MTGTAITSKFATWSAPGHSVRIEYSAAVLDEIRQTAVDGYHRVPHGGVETGGILFGTHQGNAVRIQAWRPIACEYAKGPSFLLSEKEEAALTEALHAWRGDAALAGLEPVGWYRAHTRSEIFLSDADLAFFNRFFPEPWQAGLIVRPASFAPTRAGFFFREADGRIRAQSSYHEFTFMPVAMDQAAVDQAAKEAPGIPKAPPSAPLREAAPGGALPEAAPGAALPEAAPGAALPEAAPGAALPEAAPGAALPEAAPGSALPKAARVVVAAPEAPPAIATERHPVLESTPQPPLPSSGAWLKWSAAGLGVLAFAALGFWLLKPSPSLKLAATDMGGQLRIAWDGAARPISRATSGWIEFDDHGVRTQVKLTAADLRSGSVFYARQSGDVAVRLTVEAPGSAPVAETTRFLRPGESGTAPTPAPRLDAGEQPEPPQQAAAGPVRVEAPPLAVQPPAPSARARPAIAFRAPDAVVRQPATDLPAIAPPKIENLPAAPPAGLTSVLGPAPAPPVAPAAPPRPASAAPIATPVASGRIIWTGKLTKNGRLAIERNHASSGAISGALPAVAARVSAYPGDLTNSGITLYTADPRYAQPRTEKAGAENGWNPTTYTWEPKRAAGIKVVEQPGPQNDYKVVLESEIAKLSVVVLEWRATP